MKLDLSTHYLGLKLRSPLIVGASPLCQDLDKMRELDDAGIGAVVMHSLFEEQYLREQEATVAHTEVYADAGAEASGYFSEAYDYTLRPDEYLRQIQRLRSALSVPVIASLNGCTNGGWLDFAQQIEQAGADALELNVYRVATDAEQSSAEIEDELVDLVLAVRERVRLPLAIKLSPFYTSIPHVVKRLSECAANGVVLFNRFYQPDLDIENLDVVPRVPLSTTSALLLRLRWLAILYARHPLSLALSGGSHRAEDVIKGLMAGADVIQLTSFLLRQGVESFAPLQRQVAHWLEEHEVSSVSEIRGSLSLKNCPDPAAFERAQYMQVLQGWKV